MSTPRLPFNPRETAAAQQAALTSCASPVQAAADKPLTVEQLSAIIGVAVERAAPGPLTVVGEVSGFRCRTHWYFELKDAHAVVSCAMFASATKRADIQPRDGLLVRCRGRLEWYAKSGKVTFVVDSMQAQGAGALDAKFRALVEEVRALGWLSPERKRPLPIFPRRVAVITSRSGAALQDVLDTMRRRCPSVSVLIVDVRVQGDVAHEVASAIREVSARASELGVDAVLLTRGGGSAEELFLFNDREIARAIVECAVPVVAAIGHETDTTLAELVADERCATPTQAAVRLSPDQSALLRQLASVGARLDAIVRQSLRLRGERVRALARSASLSSPFGALLPLRARARQASVQLARLVERRLASSRDALHRASERLERSRPHAILSQRRERVSALARSLHLAARARTQRARAILDSLARQLDALSPFRTLDRGYSITTALDGRLLRSVSNVAPGDRVRTRLADGSFDSTVAEGVEETSRSSRSQTKLRAGPRAKPHQPPPGLFCS